MTAFRLDHVNIRTARLAESVAFYRDALGLKVVPPPMGGDLSKGAYACDGSGHRVVHLVGTERRVEGGEPVRGAAQRGMIDHFALGCEGDPAALRARLEAYGQDFEEMTVPQISRHLFFVRDPNGVMVELGFPFDGQ